MNEFLFKEDIKQQLRRETHLIDRQVNISYLKSLITPLIRGAIEIQDRFAKFSEYFSSCMRLILSVQKMGDDGSKRNEELFLLVMSVWRTINYDTSVMLIQEAMRETESAFDKVLPPLKNVLSCYPAQQDAQQPHQRQRAG